jgi:hypothetical protein
MMHPDPWNLTPRWNSPRENESSSVVAELPERIVVVPRGPSATVQVRMKWNGQQELRPHPTTRTQEPSLVVRRLTPGLAQVTTMDGVPVSQPMSVVDALDHLRSITQAVDSVT